MLKVCRVLELFPPLLFIWFGVEQHRPRIRRQLTRLGKGEQRLLFRKEVTIGFKRRNRRRRMDPQVELELLQQRIELCPFCFLGVERLALHLAEVDQTLLGVDSI
jgi:hypothetical protein